MVLTSLFRSEVCRSVRDVYKRQPLNSEGERMSGKFDCLNDAVRGTGADTDVSPGCFDRLMVETVHKMCIRDSDYTMRQVLNLYLKAWECGVKTVYYVRSKSLEVEECESCSS